MKKTSTIVGRALLLGSILGVAAAATGCGGQIQTRGARSLIPMADEDQTSIWVWINASDGQSGVYRCVDNGNQVFCRRAPLVDQ